MNAFEDGLKAGIRLGLRYHRLKRRLAETTARLEGAILTEAERQSKAAIAEVEQRLDELTRRAKQK